MRRLPATFSLVTLVAIAGCSSSSSGGGNTAVSPAASATAPADPTAATAQIKTTWTTFFHTGTKPKAAEALLENGSKLAAAIRVASRFQQKQKLTEDAQVLKVTFTSPTAATVTYNLLSHGQTLLPNATGQAVLQDGQWKVSQATFCTLVGLAAGGTKIPGC